MTTVCLLVVHPSPGKPGTEKWPFDTRKDAQEMMHYLNSIGFLSTVIPLKVLPKESETNSKEE